jgi:hypothetical protein
MKFHADYLIKTYTSRVSSREALQHFRTTSTTQVDSNGNKGVVFFLGQNLAIFLQRNWELFFPSENLIIFFPFFMKKIRQNFNRKKMKEKNTAKERYIYKSLNY